MSNTKALIRNEQTYVLDRKLLTIHSEDRDISKWKSSSYFEIMMPEPLLNVQSLRLVEISLPCDLYTFSGKYQNTKMSVTVGGVTATITIEDGLYTPNQLANELTNLLNASSLTTAPDMFNVLYNEVSHKFWFGTTSNIPFTLNFDQQISYSDVSGICYENLGVWDYYTKWGLPSYLGFNKETYNSSSAPAPNVNYNSAIGTPSNIWKDTAGVDITDYVIAPLPAKLQGDAAIYMELEKYNSMDELYPYSRHTTATFNNDFNGRVNSAFAKIPLQTAQTNDGNSINTYRQESKYEFLMNATHYDPPLERLSKLKFKFRYHDGRLVDFQDIPVDFTIEFNMLRNEIARKYSVREPRTIYTT